MDYYAVLGIERDAKPDEIKKAYRRLSLKCHPDKPTGDENAFKQISEAYSTLSNEHNRHMYDMQQRMPFGEGSFLANDGFIKMFFNGAGEDIMQHIFNHEQQMRKPVPIIKTIDLTMSQAYNGLTVPIEIERWIQDAHNGKRVEGERIYVDIPRGIDNNEMIVLKEKGNILDHGKGDVKCFIKVSNDTPFVRNGLDLILNKAITLREALCGFSFNMEFIDGKSYVINNKNKIIPPGYRKTIPDMGFVRNNTCGDLLLDFDIQFPKELTTRKIELLRELL